MIAAYICEYSKNHLIVYFVLYLHYVSMLFKKLISQFPSSASVSEPLPAHRALPFCQAPNNLPLPLCSDLQVATLPIPAPKSTFQFFPQEKYIYCIYVFLNLFNKYKTILPFVLSPQLSLLVFDCPSSPSAGIFRTACAILSQN